ncbi:hypothetical protein MMC29_002529 [Sticta canariensis]|nr:hypothetical protein [Sticta canariensis]
MASSQHSPGQGDSPEIVASMTLVPSSETENTISLEPSTKEEGLSSDSSETPSHQPPRGPFKARAKKFRKARQQALSTSGRRHPPLRPAKDILSRIRHDPALDDADFIVGYHDRHADVMELPVSSWRGGGDVTDEEFIPQHRILYFRRKEDGIKVWDRKERLDLLFNSGNGSVKDDEKKVDAKIAKEVNAESGLNVGTRGKDEDADNDTDGSLDDEMEMVSDVDSKVKDDKSLAL